MHNLGGHNSEAGNQAQQRSGESKMKFLVIDDDPIVLKLVPMLLRQEGHTDITTAASGKAALEMLDGSGDPFDMLLVDIEMPEMSGIEVCAKVRQLPAYSRTPIIMLTARSDTNAIESAFSAGANDYITKPFDISSIGARTQIAQRMMGETCKAFTYEALSSTLPVEFEAHDFDIKDPVVINDLNQHTDPFSLGNYLSQLAQQRVTETAVFGIKIDNFDLHYNELSGREMLLAIAAVSGAISAATAEKQLLNAYFGAGTFMCISNNQHADEWLDLEVRINDILSTFSTSHEIAVLNTLAITMGRPHRPYLSKTQRVRRTFDRARAQMEKRFQSKMNAI